MNTVINRHTVLLTAIMLLVTILLPVWHSTAGAQETSWPTYRHDNARSGVTTETLDLDKLNPGWTYQSPVPPLVAWDGGAPWDAYKGVTQVPMRDFDFVFFVTVADKRVYFGSSVTDSVHCLDAISGRQLWFFRTDGPVRFPPTIDNGKGYFGSDDGYLYCIDAVSGELVWKYSPGSDGRLVGNNGKLITMQPVRTGTAVHNGRVYFAASLVNWRTSYLCALNALTGSDSGAELYKTSGGVVPMGAILVSDTKIYLPQGRMYPYVFNRATGDSLGSVGDYGNGGCFALLSSDSSLFHGVGRKKASGNELREYNAETKDTIASHSNGRRIIVADGKAYLLTTTTLSAINRSNGSTIWSIPCDNNNALILADDILFAGGTDQVVAYNSVTGEQIWSKSVNGRARGLAVADKCLYVSTDTGAVHKFGSGFLQTDLDESGTVDVPDLLDFSKDFLKSTNPTDPDAVNLRDGQ